MKDRGYNKLFKDLLAFKPWIFTSSFILNIFIFAHAAAVAFCVRGILNSIETGVIHSGEIIGKITPFIIGIAAASLIRMIAIRACGFLDNIQSYQYTNIIRINMMKKLFKRKNLKDVIGNSEKIFEVLDDDVPCVMFPSMLLGEVLGYVVYTIIAIGSLLLINWKVTAFIFIPVSLTIIVIKRATKKIKDNRKENRKIHDKVSESISDAVNLIQTIKTSRSEARIIDNFQELNEKRMRVVLKETLFNSNIQAIIGSTIYIGTAIMMLVVAKKMTAGEFPIGDFSIFICYLGALASCVDRVAELITEMKKAEVSYSRIMKTIDSEQCSILTQKSELKTFGKYDEWTSEKQQVEKLRELKVENLSYIHEGEKGIKDISFNIKPEMLVVISGGVGSGKSTVVNTLMGILPKKSGKIQFNGEEIEDTGEFFKSPMASYSSQITKLFNETVIENITMGLKADESEINQVLHDSVLEKTIDDLQDGKHTMAGNNGDKLSGGQRQRVALARMLFRKSQLYVMDDSCSALDMNTEKIFWDRFMDKLKTEKSACLIATNKKEVLKRADLIIHLKDGKEIDRGSAEELVERCSEFKMIYA